MIQFDTSNVYIEKKEVINNGTHRGFTIIYFQLHRGIFFLVTSQFLFLARLIRAVIKLFPLSKEQ